MIKLHHRFLDSTRSQLRLKFPSIAEKDKSRMTYIANDLKKEGIQFQIDSESQFPAQLFQRLTKTSESDLKTIIEALNNNMINFHLIPDWAPPEKPKNRRKSKAMIEDSDSGGSGKGGDSNSDGSSDSDSD
jgi:hypothetical protein